MRARLLRTLLSFVFTVGSLFLPAQSQAISVCQDIFTPSSALGAFKASFKHDPKYSNELSERVSIKNQRQLGTCHLHSWVGSVERAYTRRTGESLKLSMPYLTALHWFDQAIKAVNNTETDFKIHKFDVQMGASVTASRDVIRKYGLVPEEVWSPKTSFEKAPYSTRLEEFLVNRIAKAKWEHARELNEAKKNEISMKMSRDIMAHFIEVAGAMPQKFEYKGRTYTPVEFAKEKFPEVFEPIVNVTINSDRREPTYRGRNSVGDTIIDTSINNVEPLLRAAIDSGESVYLSYEHNSNYVDKATAVMSIGAFNLPPSGGPMTRAQRDYYNTKEGGHAVQIVGYDADPVTGKIVKWKIQNSWGEKAGDRGIYHMYNDYFRAFAKGVTFSAAAKVELPSNEVKGESQYLLRFD